MCDFAAPTRIGLDDISPAGAFWSLTLYDREIGFIIPSEHKKYGIGKNGGTEPDDEGGFAIYIAAGKPEGVPDENWLPIARENFDLSPQMQLYEPDLDKLKPGTHRFWS